MPHSLEPPAQRLLNRCQALLQTTYEVNVPELVHRFVFTDPALATLLRAASASHDADEAVYLTSDEQGMELSVFLTASLLEQLARDDPTRRLHEGNLANFCTVIEGVSHFLYLVWNARRNRRVSLLELEIQAEVDKFVAATGMYFEQAGTVPDTLHARLFTEVSYEPSLDVRARERYEAANQYAARYCRRLQRAFGGTPAHPALPNELRRFYRLPREEKLRRIARGQ